MWPNSGNRVPGKKGVGVTKALAGYAKWFSTVVLPDRMFSTAASTQITTLQDAN